MVAPFANYSVRGWVWYQGENNCYGDMGNSATGVGYGCELPAMVSLWRSVWRLPDLNDPPVFGVATLAAGGSEGAGQHMAGMRCEPLMHTPKLFLNGRLRLPPCRARHLTRGALGSQTANYGTLPNELMPYSFVAQVYDLGDPWAAREKVAVSNLSQHADVSDVGLHHPVADCTATARC